MGQPQQIPKQTEFENQETQQAQASPPPNYGHSNHSTTISLIAKYIAPGHTIQGHSFCSHQGGKLALPTITALSDHLKCRERRSWVLDLQLLPAPVRLPAAAGRREQLARIG
jgi:hypothetical protein